jgi:hypothetical protein
MLDQTGSCVSIPVYAPEAYSANLISMKTVIKFSPSSSVQIVAAPLLAIMMSACGLLTIERIDDQRPVEPLDSGVHATMAALDSRIDQQAELIRSMATQVSFVSTQEALKGTQIAYLATRAPASGTMVVEASITPSGLVVGTVEIEQGLCCVGGTAGEETDILVAFNARGSVAPVTEMRYTSGMYSDLDQEFNALGWVTYSEVVTFSYLTPINWSGFYIRVQFRDALGNLSPIYHDDISVEGMPATTPPP